MLETGIIRASCALTCNGIGNTLLDVHYENKKLEKLCTNEREMRRQRADVADRLRLRIKALETAGNVGELNLHDPLGNWHRVSENLDGLWAGKLSSNYRLLVRPAGADEPRDAVIVTVIDITDYH